MFVALGHTSGISRQEVRPSQYRSRDPVIGYKWRLSRDSKLHTHINISNPASNPTARFSFKVSTETDRYMDSLILKGLLMTAIQVEQVLRTCIISL